MMSDHLARAGPSNAPPPHAQFPPHINNNVTQHNNHPSASIPPLKIPPPGGLPMAPGTPGTPGQAPGPMPVPQTPAGAPPPGHPQFEVDMPPELLQQGWRKYWSRRENRPYFFNRAPPPAAAAPAGNQEAGLRGDGARGKEVHRLWALGSRDSNQCHLVREDTEHVTAPAS